MPTFDSAKLREALQSIIGQLTSLLGESNGETTAEAAAPEVEQAATAEALGEGKLVKQSGGRGQYGHVVIKVRPGEKGSGIVVENKTVGGTIPKEYINACKSGCMEAVLNGIIAGYPVIDMHIDLLDGSSHEVDSNENAFKMAAIFAVKDALKKAKCILLEPIMAVECSTPEDYQGDIMGDLNRRRGKIQGMDSRGTTAILRAEVPLAEMFGYSTAIRTLSSGRASYSMQPSHFEQVPQQIVEQIVEQRGGAKN
jgi:elongation factor G